MPDTPDRLADAIRRVLKEEMQRSPAVRTLLVELAELVLAESDALEPASYNEHASGSIAVETGEVPGVIADPEGGSTPRNANGDSESVAPTGLDESVTGTVPLTLGGAEAEIKVTGAASHLATLRRAAAGTAGGSGSMQQAPVPKPIDLELVEERARLKAESCRFFIERRRDRGDPVREPALKARMDAMIATAKSMPDCFLWVFWPYEDQPGDEHLLQIAACYEALADAVTLCLRAVASDSRLGDSEREQAFQLLAEASSALRVALGVTWLTSDDTDQEETHLWLRRETFERTVFVERHMKADDPASPEHAPEVSAEAKRLIASEEARLRKARQVSQLVNKAVYHARRIRNGPQEDRHDFETINRAMEELRSMGVGPTDPRIAEFRESVEGIAFPADLPRHEHLAFESRRANAPAADQDDRWSERVAEVRPVLEGGRIVIVGGEPRQDAIARLEDAFGATIEWVELTEHGSGARMQAPIQRPDTRVVLLLIKLTGHLHADEAREYSRAAGVPCVNMEAGYNPNMVAEQVMLQAGERLGGSTADRL